MFRCSKNGQTFRSRNSDGLLSHIKGSIACRISVGGGGGGHAPQPEGARLRAGLTPASASNKLSCLLEMLHSKQLRSIKMLIDSNHGIYRDLPGLTASSKMKEQPMNDEKPMGQVIQIDEHGF